MDYLSVLDDLPGLAECLDNLLRSDKLSEIGIVHLVVGNRPSGLLLRLGLESSEDGIELAESRLGPNDQASEMTSRSDLEEVEPLHMQKSDSGDVAESTSDSGILSVDDDRSELLLMTASASLSDSSAHALGVVHLRR